VQPLQEGIYHGFEYTRPEDLAQVTNVELIEDEVLERIQGVLQAISVIPDLYSKCDHKNPPADVSIVMCAILKFVETDACKLLTIDAHLGHNFDDLPTLPSHAGFEGTSGSGTASAGVGGGSTALAIPVDNEAKSDSKVNPDDFIV